MSETSNKTTITYEDGTIYEGEILDGIPEGLGKITHPDGSTYIGEFKDGRYHGFGTLTIDGIETNGLFKDGEYIE